MGIYFLLMFQLWKVIKYNIFRRDFLRNHFYRFFCSVYTIYCENKLNIYINITQGSIFQSLSKCVTTICNNDGKCNFFSAKNMSLYTQKQDFHQFNRIRPMGKTGQSPTCRQKQNVWQQNRSEIPVWETYPPEVLNKYLQ